MQLTFTGETFKDLLGQMAAVAVAMGTPAAMPSTAVVEPAPISREIEKTETEIETSADTLPQTAVEVLSPADIAKLKEKALEKMRDVYSAGPEGPAKVKVLTAKYGVKKFASVPDERVAEFYADAMEL
jgi:hypothetical protein